MAYNGMKQIKQKVSIKNFNQKLRKAQKGLVKLIIF